MKKICENGKKKERKHTRIYMRLRGGDGKKCDVRY